MCPSHFCRVRDTSPSSQSHLKFCRVRVESQELSSHFESLIYKLVSMSSHTKFQTFPIYFWLQVPQWTFSGCRSASGSSVAIGPSMDLQWLQVRQWIFSGFRSARGPSVAISLPEDLQWLQVRQQTFNLINNFVHNVMLTPKPQTPNLTPILKFAPKLNHKPYP